MGDGAQGLAESAQSLPNGEGEEQAPNVAPEGAHQGGIAPTANGWDGVQPLGAWTGWCNDFVSSVSPSEA